MKFKAFCFAVTNIAIDTNIDVFAVSSSKFYSVQPPLCPSSDSGSMVWAACHIKVVLRWL
jgi:hypothetical protein